MNVNSEAFRLEKGHTLRRAASTYQPETHEVIQEFLRSYKINHWRLVARTVKQHLDARFQSPDGEVSSEGIQALVIYRAKTKESLEEKLKWRHKEEPFKSVQDIEERIKDFAGVRVILIIPSPRQFKKVDDIIKDLFGEDLDRKEHGNQLRQPEVAQQRDGTSGVYQPTHLGYQGVHYRPKLDKNKHRKPGVYDVEDGDKVEIQVTSALGHAWAEAGHDILYKSYLYGEASMQEWAIYDALNGLVTSGNLLLKELHELVNQRSYMRFKDPYQLESYLGTLDLLQDEDNIPELAKLLPRESSEVLLKVLQLTNNNYPLAIRKALIKLDYVPEGRQGEQLLANFRPTFEPSEATKFLILLAQHFLQKEDQLRQPIPDAASRCRLMMSALCFLQNALGSRYTKGFVGQFLAESVRVSDEVQKALTWMVKSPDRYICFTDNTHWEHEMIEAQTGCAWPWFLEQAKRRESICGLSFKLAVMGAIKPFELHQSLYELDNMGPITRRSTDTGAEAESGGTDRDQDQVDMSV